MSTEKNVQSFGVASTLTTQRGVYVSGANTVAYPAAATNLPIGITNDDVQDTNQAISVVTGGITKLQFNDTVAVGGLVALNIAGQGIPFVAGGTTTVNNAYIGLLVDAAVAATGTIANVLVKPGFGG